MTPLLLLTGPIIILYCIAAYYEFKKNIIPDIIPILITSAGVLSILLTLFLSEGMPTYPSILNRIIGFIIPFIIIIYLKRKKHNIKTDHSKLILSTGFFFGLYMIICILVICFIIGVIYYTISKKKEIPYTIILFSVLLLLSSYLFFFGVLYPYQHYFIDSPQVIGKPVYIA